ncbi:MAG TPA: hypothetical protein VG796_24940 [Verrucomicrobiales bacterium]|nr:hypothetical protein [Verrucomicrobiales bacterium]
MPLEDTYILEGIIQGPMPARGDAAASLESIGPQLGGRNGHFSFQRDGGQFSLLADEKTHDSRAFHPLTLQASVQQALEKVMEHLSPPERMQVFSTLRCREYRMGCEQQTLYQIVPPGIIQVHSRDTPADVQERPKPWTRKEKVLFGMGAAGLLGLVVGVSTFFIDYRSLFGRALTNIRGTSIGELKVDATPLNGYVQVEAKELNTAKDTIILTLTRGPKWEEGIATTKPPPAADWPTALALEALQKKYAMVLLIDTDGRVVRSSVLPLDGLFAEKTCPFAIEFGSGRVLKSVVVRP